MWCVCCLILKPVIIQFSAFPDQSQSKTQAEAGWIIRNHKNIIYIILSIYSTNLACILFFYLELCHIPDHIPSHQHTIGSPAYCFKLTTTVITTSIRQDHLWLMDSTKSSSQRGVNLATWDMESNIPDNLETEKEIYNDWKACKYWKAVNALENWNIKWKQICWGIISPPLFHCHCGAVHTDVLKNQAVMLTQKYKTNILTIYCTRLSQLQHFEISCFYTIMPGSHTIRNQHNCLHIQIVSKLALVQDLSRNNRNENTYGMSCSWLLLSQNVVAVLNTHHESHP